MLLPKRPTSVGLWSRFKLTLCHLDLLGLWQPLYCGWVAFLCIVCAHKKKKSATVATPESFPQQTTRGWHRGAAQHAPPEGQRPQTWNEPLRLSCLGAIGPPLSSPTSTTAVGPAFEGARLFYFNCNGRTARVPSPSPGVGSWVQETKLGSSFKEFTECATNMSSSVCLIVTYFPTMPWRKLEQLRPTLTFAKDTPLTSLWNFKNGYIILLCP